LACSKFHTMPFDKVERDLVKRQVGAEQTLHYQDFLSTPSVVSSPQLKTWGYSAIARTYEQQKD
jgi:hypothetical protein